MAKKKVIITGCSGFIGSHLSEYLMNEYDIIGIDKIMYHSEIDKFHTFINADITDDNFKKWGSEIKDVYAVIHLAAKAGVRESQDKFDEYVKDNILGTKSILDMCVKSWKPKKVLIASSSSVYGDRKEDEYHPKSLYAMSKVATEMIAESYRNNELLKDTQICCMRIFTVYGPGQRKGLAIGNFINNILQDKAIIVYGDGTQRRDFTYVDDLCKSIEYILECDSSLPHNIDIGFGRNVQLNEIIYHISKLLNKKITIQYEDWDKQDVYETKAKSNDWLYGEIIPIVEGLKRQIEWQEKELTK